MKTPRWPLFAAVGAVALVGAYAYDPTWFSKSVEIKIAYIDHPSAYLLMAAASSKCPQRHGFRLVLDRRSWTLRDSMQEMQADRADLAMTYVTQLVIATSRTEDIGVLAEVYSSSRNLAVLAHRSSSITKLSDLRGRKVAFTKASSGEWYLDLIEITEGIHGIIREPRDNRGAALTAFADKQVDAIVINQPGLDELFEVSDRDKYSILTTPVYAEAGMLVMKKSRVNALKPWLKQLLTCLIEAEHEFPTATPEAVAIINRYSSPHSASALRNFLARSSMNVRLSNTVAALYDEQMRWSRSRPQVGAKSDVLSFGNLVIREPLQKVAPQAVTLDALEKAP